METAGSAGDKRSQPLPHPALAALGTFCVMLRAAPLGRTVSLEEDMTAIHLIGKSQDSGKQSTCGILAGKVVIVDYGWWIRPRR